MLLAAGAAEWSESGIKRYGKAQALDRFWTK